MKYLSQLILLWNKLIGGLSNNNKKIRAAGIIIHNGNILLMYRLNKGKEYYVFPGGAVKIGESIEQAVKREVREETSCKIAVEKLLYHLIYNDIDNEQFFYLCRYMAGRPKLGNANELAKMTRDGDNYYKPVWLKIKDLPNILLYPLEIRDWLMEDLKNNFEHTPKIATLNYFERRQDIK